MVEGLNDGCYNGPTFPPTSFIRPAGYVLRPTTGTTVPPPPSAMPQHLPALVAVPTLPLFVEHLQQACEGHGMGFHFEEGGCWGMALALADTLRDPAIWEGLLPTVPEVQLRVRTEGFVHAFVSVGDLMVDYRGAWRAPNPSDSRLCDEEQLRQLARRFGVPDQDLNADRESARAVIETATLWTVPEPIQPPRSTLGATIGHGS